MTGPLGPGGPAGPAGPGVADGAGAESDNSNKRPSAGASASASAFAGDGGLTFPAGFAWGAATAAYQVEGAAHEDGKGPSIWDTFAHTPGAVHHGDTGDMACDHYHRVASDVGLMADLGLTGYRFSVSWPRIQPDGTGPVNQRGIDHYRRLVDLLREQGIAPVVTLYHWDLPQALQDRGGWTARDTADRFADYAAAVAGAIDGADRWITINEPWVAAHEGYSLGTHAPGGRDFGAALAASHHLLLAHGRAVPAIRAALRTPAPVGITLNLVPAVPGDDDAASRAAAWRADGYHNRWYLDPVLRGEYPADMLALYGESVPLDFIDPADLAEIAAPLDFLGINYYNRTAVRAAAPPPDATPDLITATGGQPPRTATDTTPLTAEEVLRTAGVRRPELAVTSTGWTIEPAGLRDILLRVAGEYPALPLYVTENGAAYHDYPDPDGRVKDPERIAYLHGHIAAVHEAIAGGADVRGYFCWSLLDNFEWNDGYSQRFGLVYVDYATQRRTPKSSAWWYAAVARTNRLVPAAAPVSD
jgi:beta-glucosidase